MADRAVYVKEEIVRGVQLFLIYASGVWVSPWVQTWLPEWPPILVDALLALLAAVVLEVARFLLFGRPVVDVVWTQAPSPNRLTLLEVDTRSLTSGVARFEVSIRNTSKAYFGSLLLRYLVRHGLILHVSTPGAPAYATVDYTDPHQPKEAFADPVTRGFYVNLHRYVDPDDSTWVWAEVTLTPTAQPGNEQWKVESRCTADSPRPAKVLAGLVRVTSDAKHVSMFS